MSERIAKKRGVTQDEIKAEWKELARLGKERGNWYHAIREKEEELDAHILHKHEVIDNHKAGFDLYNLTPGVYPELMLHFPEYGIAGTSDRVEIFEDKTFDLSDYKTDKSLDFESFKVFNRSKNRREPKMMFEPVSHLEDCNGIHYSLQLSLYAYILEQRGYTLKSMWLEHAVFEDEKLVKVVRLPIKYLKKEAEDICKDFAVKQFLQI